MSLVRITQLAVSLDGYATGEGQSLDAPFGHAGGRLMEWMAATRLGAHVHGEPATAPFGVDDALVHAGWDGSIGAEIMGRRKFTPQTGPWTDDGWRGWWGEEPPFETPVYVMTHHPHPSIEMANGTSFHFVDGSPEEVLAAAREAASGKDVRIGGGPTTARQFLAAGLVDHAHLVIVPIILGRGVSLWEGLEGLEERYDMRSAVSPTTGVTHLTMQRRAG